jgi:hypothetical protein
METGGKIVLTAVGLVIGLLGGIAGIVIGLAVYEALGGGDNRLNVFTIFGFIFGCSTAFGAYQKFVGEKNLF